MILCADQVKPGDICPGYGTVVVSSVKDYHRVGCDGSCSGACTPVPRVIVRFAGDDSYYVFMTDVELEVSRPEAPELEPELTSDRWLPVGAPSRPRAVLSSVADIEPWARGLERCGDFVAVVDDAYYQVVRWPQPDRTPGRIEFWEVRYRNGRWYIAGREPSPELPEATEEGREFEPESVAEVHVIARETVPEKQPERPIREVQAGMCGNDKWCADTGGYEPCAQRLGHRDQCRTRRELDAKNAARMARRKAIKAH